MIRLILYILFISFSVRAELLSRTLTVTHKESNLALARNLLMEQSIQQVSHEIITEIIGDSKFSRNKSLIQKQIIRNSSSYIPYTKVISLVGIPQGSQMSLTLQLDVAQLQNLLLKNGLFYESDMNPSVLPAIRWRDRSNQKTFAWWQLGGDPDLQKFSELQERSLARYFSQKGFYSLKPTHNHYSMLLPSSFHQDRLSSEDFQILGPALGAQISIEGRVELSGKTTHLSLTAKQIVNDRVIGEVFRKRDGEVNNKSLQQFMDLANQDLVMQVHEAWQKGSIGSTVYRLVMKGSFDSLFVEKALESFKSKLRQIKSIKPRSITSDLIVFEFESTLDIKQVAEDLGDYIIDARKFRLDSTGDREIIYRMIR